MKVRLYGEHANVHQSHSQNDSGDLRGVAGGDGELGCLCGKAGTSHVCDGSAHSSGCVVNCSIAMAAFCVWKKSASVPAVTPVTVVLPNTRHITRVCTFYMHTQYYKCLLRAEITACAHTLTAC